MEGSRPLPRSERQNGRVMLPVSGGRRQDAVMSAKQEVLAWDVKQVQACKCHVASTTVCNQFEWRLVLF